MGQDINWGEVKKEAPTLCEGRDSIEQAVAKCDRLEDLFALWKAAHLCEQLPEDHYPDTYPLGAAGKQVSDLQAFKRSFCPDGVTSIGASVEQPCTHKVQALFILKEANLTSEDTIKPETGDCFWFNDCQTDQTRMDYAQKFKLALNKLGQSDTASFGYMNLNKRGGFGKCNDRQLRNYVKKYQCFIKKEIELLAPNIMICFGCFDVVAGILGLQSWEHAGPQQVALPDHEAPVDIHYVYHPSCARYEKSLENLDRPTS